MFCGVWNQGEEFHAKEGWDTRKKKVMAIGQGLVLNVHCIVAQGH